MAVTVSDYRFRPDHARAMALTPTQTMQRAVALFQQGNLAQTQVLCDQLLSADRNDCGALHLRALIALQNDRVAEAVEFLRRSLAVNPRQPAAHLNLANAFLRAGKPQAALASCDTALGLRPDYAEALVNRGNALLDLGKVSEALASYDRAMLRLPDLPALHNNRGRALRQLNRPAEAVIAFRQALRLDPQLEDALVGVVDSLRELGQLDEALKCADDAVARAPRDADALHARARVFLALKDPSRSVEDLSRAIQMRASDASLWMDRGSALFKSGRIEEALADYERALTLAPNEREAHFNRANALFGLQRYEEALAQYDRVVAEHPVFSLAHYHRGNTLRRLGRPEEALNSYCVACLHDPGYVLAIIGIGNAQRDLDQPADALRSYDRALELDPQQIDALTNRSRVLLLLRRPEEAVACLQRVLELAPDTAPDDHHTLGMLMHARLLVCDWRDYDSTVEAIIAGVKAGKPVTPPSFLPTSVDSAEIQQQCAQKFVADRWKSMVPPPRTSQPYEHSRVRIAYVSADYHEHPVSMLMAGLFETHDRERFEITGISLRPPDSSALGQRVRAAFDHYIDVSKMSDREAADWMCQREIDIAVDLTGYTAGFRPAIFAMRGAPVQVNYLGYPGTLAAPYMDYVLADRYVIPAEHTQFYNEQVAYLPGSYFPHDAQRVVSDLVPSRAEAGLPQDAFVFCSFNAHHKITPRVFDAWMRLLQSTPQSVLWLARATDPVVRNLRQAAQSRGIDPDRLIFAPRVDKMVDHLARYRCADLFLDTFPYNAHTTASDALLAGLPVLTCSGQAFASRVAASLLLALDLPELICADLSGYEAQALHLANHPQVLQDLASRLDQQKRTSALFDMHRFRAGLEAAYLTMWRRRESGLPPASFELS